jgi:hypothetical protein
VILTTWWDSSAKSYLIIFFKSLLITFFKRIKHIEGACIIRFTKLLWCIPRDPKKVILLFDKWAEKNRRISL